MAKEPPPPSVPEFAAPKQAFPATHFRFEHKVFSVDGSFFSMDANSGKPTYYVPLGEINGVLSIPQLLNGFNLAGTKDEDLLKFVELGLKYVKRIHPGDSIPSEILDGSASWSVDDRHRMIAESRLRVLLGNWIAGKEAAVRDVSELLKMANDPEIRDKMQEAVTAIAEKIGLGRDNRVQVLDRIDKLARELAYIEALRDRFAAVKMIVMKLGQLQGIYGPERGFSDEIKRVFVLMRKPVTQFDTLFAEIDGQTSEIVSILSNFESTVTFIRETRDALHGRFMPWDELIQRWQELPVEMGTQTEGLMRVTYGFMARHFSQDETWNLQFGGPKPGAVPVKPGAKTVR
jgi:hypothetical protein